MSLVPLDANSLSLFRTALLDMLSELPYDQISKILRTVVINTIRNYDISNAFQSVRDVFFSAGLIEMFNRAVQSVFGGVPLLGESVKSKKCKQCATATATAICAKCMKVAYCGNRCQKLHWTVHKSVCN